MFGQSLLKVLALSDVKKAGLIAKDVDARSR